MPVEAESAISPNVEISFCVVNTAQRELLRSGLEAIAAERKRLPFACETLVVDNCSADGSAEMAEAHATVDRLFSLKRRAGKAHCDSLLLRNARGRYALLLNEDSELLAGCAAALHEALEGDRGAAAAGAQLLRPEGKRQPCAWRFPGVLSALAGAIGLSRLLVEQSRGERTRKVDWCQSSALLVRCAAAAEVGYLDEQFFVYSDEVDFAKRLADAGWHSLYVPSARAVHHEQLATARRAAPRIVELARNRDLYMRKHHGRAAALAVRLLSALAYAERALVALLLPGRSPLRYTRHAAASLCPGCGSGLREAAERHNGALDAERDGGGS